MKMILAVLMLGLAACGGTEPTLTEPQPPSAALTCETNLDAGTPCDPCPGAISSSQFDHAGMTFRLCECPTVDGSIKHVEWVSCGLPVESVPDAIDAGSVQRTCEDMLHFWLAQCPGTVAR